MDNETVGAVRPASSLYGALKQFGRRARQLSVARLEQIDVVLLALGDPRQLGDNAYRHQLAIDVLTTIRSIVNALPDPVDRRIADAIFAISPEFHDQTVGARRIYVEMHDLGFTDDQFKTRRQRVLRDVEAELRAAFRGVGDDDPIRQLSSDARRAARQLTWSVQHAIAYVEAFEFACWTIGYLDLDGPFQQRARQRITERTPSHDTAFWWMAQSYHHLRTLQADTTGRDLLMHHMPPGWSDNNVRIPFLDWEIGLIRGVVTEDYASEAFGFVELLHRTSNGPELCDRWIRLLSTRRADQRSAESERGSQFGQHRHELIQRLVGLANVLLGYFPRDKCSDEELRMTMNRVVATLTMFEPTEATEQALLDIDGHDVYRAQIRAIRNGPMLWTCRHLNS